MLRRTCRCGGLKQARYEKGVTIFTCDACGKKTYGRSQTPAAKRASEINWQLARLKSAIATLEEFNDKLKTCRTSEITLLNHVMTAAIKAQREEKT